MHDDATLHADEDVLTRLNRFLQTQTFTATFSQRVYDEEEKLAGDSFGNVTIQRPGKFRWEYLRPNYQLLISDGVILLNYDAELEQAVVQPLAHSMGYGPAMLLSGEPVSGKNFTIDISGHRNGLDWIQLIPKVKDTRFTHIELGLDQNAVVQIHMRDHFQHRTLIHFLRPRFDVAVQADAFQADLPPGTDVIGEYSMPQAPQQQPDE